MRAVERRVDGRQVEALADQARLDVGELQQRAGRLLHVAHRALVGQAAAFEAADAGVPVAVQRIGEHRRGGQQARRGRATARAMPRAAATSLQCLLQVDAPAQVPGQRSCPSPPDALRRAPAGSR